MYQQFNSMLLDNPGMVLILAAVVLFGWEYVKAGGSKLLALISIGKATVSTIEATLTALQQMTKWAVANAEPELLAKITALYQDLQKHVGKGAQ